MSDTGRGSRNEMPWSSFIDQIRVFCPRANSFTANSGTKAALPPKGRSSTANSGIKVAVLLGMNRCHSFPLLFAPHSLLSIWTDLKRSEKIPVAPAWRCWKWIWLTGPYGLRRNSPQRLNTSSIKSFWPDQRSGNPNHPRSVNSKDAGQPRLTDHHRNAWNEVKRNDWDECGEIVEWSLVAGKRMKPPEKPT